MEAVNVRDPVGTAIYIPIRQDLSHKIALIIDGIACFAVGVARAEMLVEVSLGS